MHKHRDFYKTPRAQRERMRKANDALVASGALATESVQIGADTPLDPGAKLIFGCATQRIGDVDGEMARVAESMARVRTWAAKFNRQHPTSWGPLWNLHEPREIGALKYLKFDAFTESLLVAAEVYDDAVWERIGTGELCGLSMSGKMKHKQSGDLDPTLKRVTSFVWEPKEISLVDYPAVETATLDAVYVVGAEAITIREVLDDLTSNTERYGKCLLTSELRKLTKPPAR